MFSYCCPCLSSCRERKTVPESEGLKGQSGARGSLRNTRRRPLTDRHPRASLPVGPRPRRGVCLLLFPPTSLSGVGRIDHHEVFAVCVFVVVASRQGYSRLSAFHVPRSTSPCRGEARHHVRDSLRSFPQLRFAPGGCETQVAPERLLVTWDLASRKKSATGPGRSLRDDLLGILSTCCKI